jgi:hypothetical protein
MKFIKIEDHDYHNSFHSITYSYFMNTYLNFISFSYLFTTYHQIFIFEIVGPYELCFY